ncbi:MAG: filamentous hemagglutinin N-terminal domain-containing protein [Proteobacteria bacterium]|nr:filamentous hemagglutinin N-terminal domain-containing protein [Pseudomonadota bacterium]
MKRKRLNIRGCLPVANKLISIITLVFFSASTVFALPAGQQTVNGQATFSTQGNNLTITNSPNSIINWQSFSIASNEAVRFIQQSGSSAVLNRVIGQDPSRILGLLQSNGRVFLINPNGILFGQGSRVDVNGLVVSTLNISNQDFLAGKYNFAAGSAAGSIQNQGIITTPAGGKVYLIAPDVENSGIINSPKGEVILAAGHSVQLVDSMDPEISVVVSAPENKAVNLGEIIASSGKVGIYGGLIQQKGHVNADSAVVGENGRIFFMASKDVTLDAGSVTSANGSQGGQIKIESESGNAQVSGMVTATGNEGKGGDIQILGNQVNLTGNAQINASGNDGGGTVIVGGDYQGMNPSIQNAEETYVGKDAVIKADATETGDGGKVVLWADNKTEFYGAISARGGVSGGDGGNAEVSGKRTLAYHGLTDLRAPLGKTGTLLLDPTDFTIAEVGGDMSGGDLGSQLDSANITIQTDSAGAAAGDITVDDHVTWGTSNTLTLSAHNNITANYNITNNAGGSLFLRSDSDGSGAGNVFLIGSVTLTGGGTASIFYNPPAGYGTPTDYSGSFTGVTPTAYMLVNNVNNLQAINTNLTGNYALGKDIDATATSGWNSGAGFVPLGDNSLTVGASFSGIFQGLGHIVTGLYINRPATQYVGPFGGTIGGWIMNVGFENVNITGGFQTGGLVAHTGSNVVSCYTTGSVTSGSNNVGGLVGLSAGSIINSYSTATVNGNTWVGGLAGTLYTGGSITNSYSSGAVSGTSSVGGLVGYNYGVGPIVSSYWDTQTSGRATSDGGTGRTTAQMKQQATFTGWDFVNIWGITESVTYPLIIGMSGGTPPSPPPPAPAPSTPSTTDTAGVTGNSVAAGDTVVALETANVIASVTISEGGSSGNQEDDKSEESTKKDTKRGEQNTYEKTRGEKTKNFCN